MQTNTTSVMSPPAPYQNRDVVQPANLPLNSHKTVQFKPPASTAPSYTLNQLPSVIKARVNKRVVDQQKSVETETQRAETRLQVADKNLAASVLTGAYSSKPAQNRGNTNVGGYISVVA